MKKILIVISLLFLIQLSVVDAVGIGLDYINNNGKYELILHLDNQKISYEEAKKQLNIDNYIKLLIDGRMHYFDQGKEVTEEEYISAVKLVEKEKKCNEDLNRCIEINSYEELIKKIDEIYNSREIGEYHLLYSSDTYRIIDFKKVEAHFKEKYVTDINKNAYKYNEYGLMLPIRFVPTHDENEMVISTLTIKTTPEEEKLVDKFLESFLKEFENKSDYEKVLGVYSYISNTATYEKDNGYTVFKDGKLSPYDVLLTHKTVCIGSSTTFQFLMEKLGIESYIIDHVEKMGNNSYITSHTYNVVKLDDKWFIVDINAPTSGDSFLIGNSSKYDSKDLKYLGIKLSYKSYYELHSDAIRSFEIDYDKYVKIADEILKVKEGQNETDKKTEVEEEKEDSKVSFRKEYVCIIGILAAISVVILYFSKKA